MSQTEPEPGNQDPDQTPADTTPGEDAPAVSPNAEAARYRSRLRETETERDTLQARLETMQRAEVERLAARLVEPSAIWAGGVTLADLLDDDGNLDPAKATAAIDQATSRLGLAVKPTTPRPDPAQGGGVSHSQENDWVAAMRPHK